MDGQKIKEKVLNIYNDYIGCNGKIFSKQLKRFFDDGMLENLNVKERRFVSANIGVACVLSDDRELFFKAIHSVDKSNCGYDEIMTDIYSMNFFEVGIYPKNIFTLEEKKKLFNMLLDKGKKLNMYILTLIAMCNLYNIEGKYYELSDTLRTAAIHLVQEDDEDNVRALSFAIGSFLKVSRDYDPIGYEEVCEILEMYIDESIKICM